MSEKIMFIHLSDIHLRSSVLEITNRAEKIAATTFQHLHDVHTLAILLSGDVAWSGAEEEYLLAERFINNIKNCIRAESSDVKIEVFVCPGNHDCDFTQNDETRDAVIGRIRTLSSTDPSESLVNTATLIQNNFFKFRENVSTQPWLFDNKLSWQTIFTVGEKFVGVRCLNVAWMSEINEKQGSIVFPSSAIQSFGFDGNNGLAVTLLHHPFNWFSQVSYRAFQSAVRNESQLIFTGHEHFQNIGEVSDLRSSPSVFVEGGVLFDANAPLESTFNVVVVDLSGEQYSAEIYRWNGSCYLADVGNEEWGSLRELPVKDSKRYNLNSEFLKTLKDAGANFSHSAKKNLQIDDIFVWPELLCVDDPSFIKKQVSGSFLEDMQNINSGVFIRGNEISGKSTLLRKYYTSYYDRGYLPLYFLGAWFTKAHKNNPLKAISYALEKQYTKEGHQLWLQEPKNKKVLLLDDVDSTKLSSGDLSECLENLFKYFSAVILTAKDGAAIMDLLSMEKVAAISHFTQYEIREFGHKKRFELVCKWAAIGGLEEGASENWMATIDKWERDLTTAIGRQFVPSVPIFLLTLLQSIESGRTADLQNSAFGHYYQFLITSALQNIGIEREQWGEVINYCANLAWFIYSSEKKYITEVELETFTSAFSDEFTPVSCRHRLSQLINAGVLESSGEDVEFKYPYLYFYFLGQYFADRIHEPEIEQAIVSLCNDLHLSDSANILLFASHHTKSPVIYEGIAGALERCFEFEPVFDFERDVELLNRLVDSAPQLIYQEAPTKEARAKVREHQDDSDLFAANDENDSFKNSDAFSAVTRLFRGIEILGQFLKNHYGTTKNQIKDELIDKLIKSALRGLYGSTGLLIQHTDALALHIERVISENSRELSCDVLKTYSRRIVFDLIGMITFGFVQKAGSAIGSAYLKGNLQGVVERNGTLGYSLVEMSHQLELPEQIPMKKLKILNESVEKNMFSRELLRSMALRHLHLFKVPYKDKQKLCEELKISLNNQMALQRDRISRIKK